MGRHLHRHRLGPGLLQAGQLRLHRQRVGRSVATALQVVVKTDPQGADQAAALAEQVERLGQQLADAGLAIGTCNSNQLQAAAGIAVEAPGNSRQLGRQALDRHHHHRFGRRDIHRAFGLIGNRRGPAGDGVGDVASTIAVVAGNGQKQIARSQGPAVQAQLADQRVTPRLGKHLQQTHRHQPRPPLPGNAPACCCSGSGGGRLSGAMFIRRRAPPITLLNTGAETRPP
ncbi:hypothetical protein D3C81_1005750 [compost metagenome]